MSVGFTQLGQHEAAIAHFDEVLKLDQGLGVAYLTRFYFGHYFRCGLSLLLYFEPLIECTIPEELVNTI